MEGRLPQPAEYQDNSGTYGTYDLDAAGTLSSDSTSAQVDQAQLAAAGIKPTIDKVPANDCFSKYVTIGNFAQTSFRWVDQTFRSQAYPIHREPSGRNLHQNYGSVGAPEIDALLEKATRTRDTAAANKLYDEAHAKIWELDHSIPLHQRPQVLAVRTDLADLADFGAGGPADDDCTKVGRLKKQLTPAAGAGRCAPDR
ncbi:hypothetical protein [Streptomyces fulvoviolaceus]|uniref:hypothetical protein n=1 Tax=Streptomyces fulvoviolaceus TaxID=285535 RepID=UPI0004CA6CCF|nr:hypothetical protein [Streptomyces fulvoviolaceus]MCT9077676.1 hypothetical protein [Streptomyces fulvoviolaceus]